MSSNPVMMKIAQAFGMSDLSGNFDNVDCTIGNLSMDETYAFLKALHELPPMRPMAPLKSSHLPPILADGLPANFPPKLDRSTSMSTSSSSNGSSQDTRFFFPKGRMT
jgi:hypothetical protein